MTRRQLLSSLLIACLPIPTALAKPAKDAWRWSKVSNNHIQGFFYWKTYAGWSFYRQRVGGKWYYAICYWKDCNKQDLPWAIGFWPGFMIQRAQPKGYFRNRFAVNVQATHQGWATNS